MIKIYHFLVCSLIFVFGANAQENPFLFVKTSEDIGTRAITCMINDSNNQLWIGTYGGGLAAEITNAWVCLLMAKVLLKGKPLKCP